MPDQHEIILDHLKELRQDNLSNARLMGEMLSEIKNLHADIKDLRECNEKLHRRIDKKDDRIRELENKVNTDEQKFVELKTEIDTTSRNNKWWIATGIAVATAVSTVMAVVIQTWMTRG